MKLQKTQTKMMNLLQEFKIHPIKTLNSGEQANTLLTTMIITEYLRQLINRMV